MNESEQLVAGGMAVIAGVAIFMAIFALAILIFFGYCYKLIAEKTGHSDIKWLWWIPIVNMWIPFKVSGRPTNWLLLLLSPIAAYVLMALFALADLSALVGITYLLAMALGIIATIAWIFVMMDVAEARGHERWWGIIAVIVSIVGVPYIAFADSKTAAPAVNP